MSDPLFDPCPRCGIFRMHAKHPASCGEDYQRTGCFLFEIERAARLEAAERVAEAAWGIIANAGGGDWTTQSKDWQIAAVKWRDEYHATLPAIAAADAREGETA